MFELLSAATQPAISSVIISPFVLLLIAIPVLLFGEQLTQRIAWLRRSNIPAPIAGGLLAALAVLLLAEFAPGWLQIQGKTTNAFWLWATLPQWSFGVPRPTDIERPLLILFFTCIGLNASWAVAKAGGLTLVIYLVIASLFAVVQTVTGSLTAAAMGEDPLMGVMCSTVSLMGGFGTSAGFAPDFEKAGLSGAATMGVASAAFGVVFGGLIAGPIAGRLIARHHPDLHHASQSPSFGAENLIDEGGFFADLKGMYQHAGSVLIHLFVLVICLKLGAFLSAYVGRFFTFPVYIGSMIVAAIIRNLHDAAGQKFLVTIRIDLIASFALAWLLSVVMIKLQLQELAHSAMPMLVILISQTILIAAFAYWIVFRIMGRSYEAITLSAGFIGFALGATSNAVATMRSLSRRFGPAPRAFLIVTVVGAFLIDFINTLIITAFLNLFGKVPVGTL